MKIAVIGAGGIGSYLVPLLAKTEPDACIEVWDADTLEKKNLDRQLFPARYLGTNKAEALAKLYRVNAVPVFLRLPEDLKDCDFVFACPDNMAARKTVLAAADRFNIPAIICGNEYESASSSYYEPAMLKTPLDYRVRYAESINDLSGDPTKHCTGAEQEKNHPQLAIANQASAAFAMQLFWFWTRKAPEIRPYKEVFGKSPLEYVWVPSLVKTITIEDSMN